MRALVWDYIGVDFQVVSMDEVFVYQDPLKTTHDALVRRGEYPPARAVRLTQGRRRRAEDQAEN